jgi:hypothetical protein
MDRRHEIESSVCDQDGMRGFTCKLKIGTQDVYLIVAFYRVLEDAGAGRTRVLWMLAHLDIRLSAVTGPDVVLFTARDAHQEVSKTDNSRAMLELLFREATTLLESGVWSESDLIRAWMATRFEPVGICQFPRGADGNVLYRPVLSPLDAAAKLIEQRIGEWRRLLEVEDAVDCVIDSTGGGTGDGGNVGASQQKMGCAGLENAGGGDVAHQH